MAKREDIYRAQLQELGIYEKAFEPEIATLAKLERRKTRAEKAWSATVPKGEKPSFLDPHYQILVQLEREILVHRETLGLTPKALRKLRGMPTAAGADEPALITRRLDLIAQRVSCYELPEPGSLDPDVAQAYAEESQSDWRTLVPTLGTGTGDTSSGAGAPPSPQGEGSELG